MPQGEMMSIKQGMLALLSIAPMGVTQLQREFEARTGGTWSLNIGQVYTTLQRLERDGLVTEPTPDPEGIEAYRLTEHGQDAAGQWWYSPVRRGAPERNELVIKIALAASVPGVDVAAVVQTQRTETMRLLRDLTKLRAHAEGDLPWSLVVDHNIFAAEAELRWLDHIEARAAMVQAHGFGGAAESARVVRPDEVAKSEKGQ